MRRLIRSAVYTVALSALVIGAPLAQSRAASPGAREDRTMQVAQASNRCRQWADSINARVKRYNKTCAPVPTTSPRYAGCIRRKKQLLAEEGRYHRSCGR